MVSHLVYYNGFLIGLLFLPWTQLQFTLGTVARVIMVKYKLDHVIPLPQTLWWLLLLE